MPCVVSVSEALARPVRLRVGWLVVKGEPEEVAAEAEEGADGPGTGEQDRRSREESELALEAVEDNGEDAREGKPND